MCDAKLPKNHARLCEYAIHIGVHASRVIATEKLLVDPGLADICRQEHCPNYGQSGSCPPYAMASSEFAQFKREFNWALVFKLEVPVSVMHGTEQPELARMVHESATSIRDFALEQGAKQAYAIAGGSCKKCFCSDFSDCRLIRENRCRFPGRACPPMSALGINFNALVELLGWGGYATPKPPEPMHEITGIVLFSP